jgi:hypothetical protein
MIKTDFFSLVMVIVVVKRHILLRLYLFVKGGGLEGNILIEWVGRMRAFEKKEDLVVKNLQFFHLSQSSNYGYGDAFRRKLQFGMAR